MINLKVKKVMTSLLAFLHYQKTNKSPETTKLIVGPAPFLVFSFYKCLVCVSGCVRLCFVCLHHFYQYSLCFTRGLLSYCLCVCVCVCVISHQSTSNKISYLNKLDALYHKTRSKVVMVLRYQGLTCIDF